MDQTKKKRLRQTTSNKDDLMVAKSFLPEDIVTEILLKLPVKSLVRFTSVCKSWNAKIYSRQFSEAHLSSLVQQQQQVWRFMVRDDNEGMVKHCSEAYIVNIYTSALEQKLNLLVGGIGAPVKHSCLSDKSGVFRAVDHHLISPQVYENMHSTVCVGSCHGLVCLSLDYTRLVLFNPTTRRFNMLPDIVSESNPPPAAGVFHYGFGFDKSSGDYKIVSFEKSSSNYNEFNDHIVRIYTPKSGGWRRIKNHIGRWTVFNGCATFATGKLHWIVKTKNSWGIAYLDMETEEYGMLHRPEFVERGISCNLVCSQGCLYAYCLLPRRCGKVWKIEGYGVGKETWTNVFTVPNCANILNRHGFDRLVHVWKNGELLLSSVSIYVIFNSNNGSVRYPHISNPMMFNGCSYFETLISPLYHNEAVLGRSDHQIM